jgi:hypothetical protein
MALLIKYCPDCGRDRPASAFYAWPSQACGLSSYCRVHQKIRSKKNHLPVALRRGGHRRLVAAYAAIVPPSELPECWACSPRWSADGFAHDAGCAAGKTPLRTAQAAAAARNGG